MSREGRVIITKGVAQYRATVPATVRPSDHVLEVGCATGATTRVLSAHARWVLAVDLSPRVEEARALGLENVRVEQWDAWDIDAIRSVSTSFDAIYVDISGCGRPERALRLLRSYDAAFDPAVIVAKNTRLRTFVSRCQVWPDSIDLVR